MKIIDLKGIQKDSLYFCYSSNLFKFLTMIKKIEPISKGEHFITKKKFSVFIKTKLLREYLEEWTANKDNNTFAFPKAKGDDYGK